jgi:protein SCO1/2
MIQRRGFFTRLAVAPAAALVALSARKSPAAAVPPAPRRSFAPPLSGREALRRRYFPNIELTTSQGNKVRFYDDLLKDKLVVINLMYAQCDGICPITTSNLKRVRRILQAQVNHDIFFYSLTLKPEQDSPAALKAYAQMHAIDDPHWLFLTGKPDEVDLLRHKIGFADPNPDVDRDKSRHSGMLRYGNEPLSIWGTCQGSGDPSWIAQEIGFAVPRAWKRHPATNE